MYKHVNHLSYRSYVRYVYTAYRDRYADNTTFIELIELEYSLTFLFSIYSRLYHLFPLLCIPSALFPLVVASESRERPRSQRDSLSLHHFIFYKFI